MVNIIRSKKKTVSLLLITLAGIEKVKAGKVFNNCLMQYKGYGEPGVYERLYDQLLNYFNSNTINNGQRLELCYILDDDKKPKFREVKKASFSSPCSTHRFSCAKQLSQSIVCDYSGSSSLPSCMGIIGEDNITSNATWGGLVIEYFGDFSKCDNGVIAGYAKYNFSDGLEISGTNLGYAKYSSSDARFPLSYCYYSKDDKTINTISDCNASTTCFWDNFGWTCRQYGGRNNNNPSVPSLDHNSANNCYFQWPADWPAQESTNPYLVFPNNSTNLIPILVPTITTVGVIVIGGATYYIINRITLNNILESINDNLTLDEINAKIKELDQYRNAEKNILKKIVWNHSKAKEVYGGLIARQEKPTLERPIGRGGFGEVYYGKWKLQDVAVKKLCLPPHNISETNIKNFKKEIDILKSLRNRHIIQYYGTYSDDLEFLIIMEYAENGTLTKFINENKDKENNWKFNTNLIKQMVSGLAYIHYNNIIHRDLKSMNILLTGNYQQAKISDFGLSKAKNISSSHSRHNATGTLGWMAPELLRDTKNVKCSEQSDIYALGMIIWEIATKCTTPFEDIDNNLIGFHIINGGKETIPNDTPKNIQNIIQQCWKDEPNNRIALINILVVIETDESDFQIISNDNSSLDAKKPLESQNIKETNELLNSKDLSLELKFQNAMAIEELVSKAKKQLSLESQQKTDQESKSIKLDINTDYNWTNLNLSFTEELINHWQSNNFTYQQTQEWINIGLQPNDYNFASWLRDIKQLSAEEVLNHYNLETLNQEFFAYWQEQQLQTHIEQPLK